MSLDIFRAVAVWMVHRGTLELQSGQIPSQARDRSDRRHGWLDDEIEWRGADAAHGVTDPGRPDLCATAMKPSRLLQLRSAGIPVGSAADAEVAPAPTPGLEEHWDGAKTGVDAAQAPPCREVERYLTSS